MSEFKDRRAKTDVWRRKMLEILEGIKKELERIKRDVK